MTAKKPILLDSSPENSADRILPRKALLSSRNLGWKDLLIEYHYQPSGEHPEVYSPGHGIVICTKIEKHNQINSTLDGKSYNYSLVEGNINIIPANMISRGNWYGERELITIGFHPKYSIAAIDSSSRSEQVEIIPKIGFSDPLIFQIGIALKTTLQNNACSRLYVETMINALAVHLIQYYSTNKPILKEYNGGLSRQKLQLVIDYIQANLERDLTLQELANLVGMSPRYFCTLFKRSTGLTPHKYVNQMRIERAKDLLLQGKISIADIAQSVGFANQSHLNLHFKRQVGVTPRQFCQR